MKLAERIFQDLCTRIEAHEGLPCKLTFSALSAHYGVSLDARPDWRKTVSGRGLSGHAGQRPAAG